jgi:flagellar hook-associated protein 3 FlgL
MSLSFLRNVNAGLSKLQRLQDTLTSGKSVSRPSHDPTSLPGILGVRDALRASRQYKRNLDETEALLRTGELAISDAVGATQRLRQLAIQAASDTLSDGDLAFLQEEASQLLDHLVALGNTQVAGRYIFGGTETTTPPFARTGARVDYGGNVDALAREVDRGVVMRPSIPGSTAFGSGSAGPGVFPAAERFLNALAGGDRAAVRVEIDGLAAALDTLSTTSTTFGALAARVDLIRNRIEDNDVALAKVLSTREDADITKTIVDLRTQEQAYQAALAAGARMIQPSLLHFLQ